VARTPLFERDLTLTRNAATNAVKSTAAPWPAHSGPKRRPEDSEFTLTVDGPLQSDTCSGNGKRRQPADRAGAVPGFLSRQRVLFKAKPGDGLFLYYGKSFSPAPRYDSTSSPANCWPRQNDRVARRGRTAQSVAARERDAGQRRVIFWGILALVVVVLLVIIQSCCRKGRSPRNNSPRFENPLGSPKVVSEMWVMTRASARFNFLHLRSGNVFGNHSGSF